MTVQAALDTAAGGHSVEHVDVTSVWRTISDLDVAALNARRSEVTALQDDLWRAIGAVKRAVETLPDSRVGALAPATDLDYGALAEPELLTGGADAGRAHDIQSEL